ncbi:Aminopropyl transferase [Balamuthia mandrillaris]
MNKIQNGWFSEVNEQWPGQAMSLEVDNIIFEGKSDFQDVMVFKSKTFGNVLVLDGVIQATERDEFAYQEMMAHLPLCAHPDPKKVLVIGGGDGGVLREIAKHQCVEEITICEIDALVIEQCKTYMPSMAVGYKDPRVNVHVGDGFKFLDEHQNSFDVIIVDSSDPVGPAQSLFEKPFYMKMHKALRDGGIVCTQGECIWIHLDLIENLVRASREIYRHVEYAAISIPTYPSGQIGAVICSKREESPIEPARVLPEESVELRYYNEDVHRAAFVLPNFARKRLMKKQQE